MRVWGRIHRLNPLVRHALQGLLLLIACLSATNFAVAQSARPSIKQFETFRTTQLGRPSVLAAGTSQQLQLAAFGQTFRLRVQQNPALAGISKDPALQLFRGTITDKPGSWVRLSYRGSQAQGLIWDGRDLYAIEPVSTVTDIVGTAATQLPAQGSIIFRLADTTIPLGADFCGAETAVGSANDGLAAYQSMMDEFDRMQIVAASFAVSGIDLSLLADAAFRAQYASSTDAENAILVRLNNLDGIFSAQLGIRMLATSVAVYGGDTLPASTGAGTLLDALSTLRATDPALQATGLTHLFTGRNLDGDTVGMAYVNTVCNARYAVGLTESRAMGAWLESLVAAHEIGHNLGAGHDSEGACAGIPLSYLMAPQINGSSTFSQCSLDKFSSTLPAAACVVPVAGANPQLPADLGTTIAALAATFDWSVSVKNAGDLEATGVQVSVRFPPGVTATEHWVEDGMCTRNANVVVCSVGGLKAGETKTLNMRLSGDTAASYAVTATVEADQDSEPADNTASATIAIRQSADVAVLFDTAPPIEPDADATLGFRLANNGPSASASLVVKLTYPADMVVSAVDLEGALCTPAALQASCTLPTLATGANIKGLVRFRTTAGTKSLQMEAQSDNYDPVPGNNSAALDLPVTAAAAAGNSKAAGGGGGVFDWRLLAALFVMWRYVLNGRIRFQANG